MNISKLFAPVALGLAAGTAFIINPACAAPLTRAEVRQSVLDARESGTLVPAGNRSLADYGPAQTGTAQRSRAEVRQEVLEARANGTLRAAGDFGYEGAAPYGQTFAGSSVLTRSEVRSQVLKARAQGALVPAGDAEDLRTNAGS